MSPRPPSSALSMKYYSLGTKRQKSPAILTNGLLGRSWLAAARRAVASCWQRARIAGTKRVSARESESLRRRMARWARLGAAAGGSCGRGARRLLRWTRCGRAPRGGQVRCAAEPGTRQPFRACPSVRTPPLLSLKGEVLQVLVCWKLNTSRTSVGF